MQFIYVLPGWEDSIADGRVLHDAKHRTNGLRVPHGYYYLVDAKYTNCIGFLASFHGQSHKEVAPFKLKLFPYYDELSMIFGKDRATGQHAETPTDVEEQLQNEEGDCNLDDNASIENVDNASDNNVDSWFVSKSSKRSQSQTECSSTSKKQRKSKSSGDLVEALTESIATFATVIEAFCSFK
ncbi:hypothetical protein EZV62_018612 [Acer yangbiense]|uniref:DDE Tnp4 domain-containing protein n=1 Tax=Acer yangbiense TaxID=1000413 RepID=A0A5C7HKF4_9ROSI|nr:hypothetical protein EZV62_018612 [Acer yangbiense]